jgi:hypothetical protein
MTARDQAAWKRHGGLFSVVAFFAYGEQLTQTNYIRSLFAEPH